MSRVRFLLCFSQNSLSLLPDKQLRESTRKVVNRFRRANNAEKTEKKKHKKRKSKKVRKEKKNKAKAEASTQAPAKEGGR
jgi:hypothetical protein